MLAFAAVLAFLFLRSMDENWALGHTAVVWVTGTDNTTSGAEVTEEIQEFARQHHASVAREVPDLHEPYSVRHLYLTDAGPRAGWLRSGYPAFGTGLRTDVHPASELGRRDPRGFYYVFGTEQDAVDLAQDFNSSGLEATVNHPFSLAQLNYKYGGSAMFWSLIVVGLAAVALTGAGVLLNAKAYGVLRLQGLSYAQMLRRDLGQLVRPWALTFAVVTATATGLLAVTNSLAWYSWYATVAALVAVLLTGIALLTHTAVLRLTFRTGVLGALKGELPSRPAMLITYAVRIPALLLTLSITVTVILAGQHVAEREHSSAVYADLGDTASIAFSGGVGGSAQGLQDLDEKAGTWLQQADRDGQIVVAGYIPSQPAMTATGFGPGGVLVVNDEFLSHQAVSDLQGHRVPARAAQRNKIRVLLPASLAAHRDRLLTDVPGLLSPTHPEAVDVADVTVLITADRQAVFTYNPRGRSHLDSDPGADSSFVTDPVIIAYPDGSGALSPGEYTSFASQSSIVFPDPDDITDGIARHHLQDYVAAVRPVGQNAAEELRSLAGDFRLHLFNLAVALVVLLITGVGVCIVHARKNAQAIFAPHISGWRFTTIHRSLLAVESALAVLLVAWAPWKIWRQNQDLAQYAARGIPAPRAPVTLSITDVLATGSLAVAEAAAVLLVLVLFHRRIVKEGATQS